MTLLSMTGFGQSREERDGYAVVVEVRSVNSRYFKLHLRMTEGYSPLEARTEAVLRERIKRGTIHCNIRISHLGSAEDYRINQSVLHQYIDQLQELAATRDLDERLHLEPLAGLPGVVEELSAEVRDTGQVWPLVESTIRQALDQLAKMRLAEGEALAEDLSQQCRAVEESLDVVEKQAPVVVEHYRQRIVDRVNESLESLNVSVEPADLVREVSLFADRADISEEIVRLRSHLQQFHQAMGLSESSGRKLEFICQEMGRETNTIGSKANDAEISAQVVEIKTALERIREQIQNVE